MHLGAILVLLLVVTANQGQKLIPQVAIRELASVCGDGIYDSFTEACDDGNNYDGDGCSSSCTVETGWTCNGASPARCIINCGNRIIESTEACDDGNTVNGDGCSSSCAIESDWTCNGAPSICQKCGNGIREGTETCDDGSILSNDGCSSACTVEFLYICNTSNPNVCTYTCGNRVHNTGEYCDDGNIANGDGCSSTCQIEGSYVCSSSYPSQCKLSCGDGIINTNEQCDDKNIISGDGCSSSCIIEENYSCNGQPSVCRISVSVSSTQAAIGSAFQSAFGVGISSQMLVSVFTNVSFSGLWGFVNTIQLINYASMFTLYYPQVVLALFSTLGVTDLQSQYLTDFYLLHFDTSVIKNRNSWDYRFENQNIESTSILMNCGDAFLILLLTTIYYFVIYILSIVFTRHPILENDRRNQTCTEKVKLFTIKKIVWIKKNLFFNIIMRIGFEVYLQFYFASLYNLRNLSLEDTAEYYSVVVSVIWQVLLTVLLVVVIIVLFTFKKKYCEEEIKDGKVYILLEEFKDNKKYLMIDHIFFMLRRILLSFIIIYGWGHGLLQGCLFIVVCAAVLLSKMILRPFRFCIMNAQSIIFEFILLFVICILTTFNDKSTEFSTTGNPNLRGIVCFGLVCSLMVISYVFSLILLVSHCWKKKKDAVALSQVRPIEDDLAPTQIKRVIDFKNESTIDQSSKNLGFKSEVSMSSSTPVAHSKATKSIIMEESKVDMTSNQNNQPAFVNLKLGFINRNFQNLIKRKIRNDYAFSGTKDNSTIITNEHQIMHQNYFKTNKMKKVETSINLDEED